MARKSKKPQKPQPIPGDTADPRGFPALMGRYLEWLRVHNYSESTLEHREVFLGFLSRWCDERGLTQPSEITRPILERYQRSLFYRRKQNGDPLSFRSQYAYLVPVRAFFKWLTRQNYLLMNPASELELPRIEKHLPHQILTAGEAETVLAVPDVSTPLGLRDRAILETFYSTGIRRKELAGLDVRSADAGRGVLFIRQGKGKKDRVIPIGERAIAWIDKYRIEARPAFALEPDDGTLFLTTEGTPFPLLRLSELVGRLVDRANVGKKGACHLLRHTMATLMLEAGADIRFIQQQLGHESLETTQIYTRVSIRALKEVHSATHPAAKLRGGKDPGLEDRKDFSEDAPEETTTREATTRKLLSTLAAEEDEDPEDEE